MYKNKYLILLAITALFGMAIISCSEDDTNSPGDTEFIADDNTFANFMGWDLEATNKGADPALGMAHAGNDESVTREIYIKDGKDRVNGEYPVGTVVVKHSFNDEGSVNEFTAMVKRGNEFNPDGGDWEWFMLTPDGEIAQTENGMPMRGAELMDGMCLGCHGAAASKDYVFSKD